MAFIHSHLCVTEKDREVHKFYHLPYKLRLDLFNFSRKRILNYNIIQSYNKKRLHIINVCVYDMSGLYLTASMV